MNDDKSNKQKGFHDEILRHLDQNPPPPEGSKKRAKKRDGGSPPPARQPGRRDSRPALMLRGMTVEAALDRLERFVRQHRSHGTRELLLIVGKGSRSPSGESILAPAVREFCEQRPALVRGIRDAPDHEGGSGAWIVELELG